MRHELWMVQSGMEYREPFFGAGAVGFRVLSKLPAKCPVWINDIDPGMVSLWTAVWKHHKELIKKVSDFKPSTDYFYKFKEEDGREDLGFVKQGFRKLALHRMSYSGLGAKSGGPLGGESQSSEYNVGCRWVPEKMKTDICRLHLLFSRLRHLRITCGDFEPLVESATPGTFLYLDPPYYEKGPALYKHSMDDAMHERLASLLRRCHGHWALSYDDHSKIRELYEWAEFKSVSITYTTARSKTSKRPKNREVVIRPKQMEFAA
jgi:DNA adenine methylase